MQPQVNLFAAYETDIDPAIVAEFAHTVYRFGHSMLTDTLARTDADGTSRDLGLIEAFLNPLAFSDGGLSPKQSAGAIVRGMTRQRGNEIDEFVTESLRNNLLGLPLDLATINLARARETGVPSLNAARRKFHEATSHAALAPYESWADFKAAPAAPGVAGQLRGRLRDARQRHRGAVAEGQAGGRRAARARRRRRAGGPARLPPRHRRVGERRGRPGRHRPRGRRLLDRRPRRAPDAVRRAPGLHLQLRLRDADGEAPGRRPLLLPGPHRRPQLPHPARGELLRRAGDAEHGRQAPAVRRLLVARPHVRAREPRHRGADRR